MAKIIAERLVAELKSSGFVIMRRPMAKPCLDATLRPSPPITSRIPRL